MFSKKNLIKSSFICLALGLSIGLGLSACGENAVPNSQSKQNLVNGDPVNPVVSQQVPEEDTYATGKDLVIQDQDDAYADNWAAATGKDLVYQTENQSDSSDG